MTGSDKSELGAVVAKADVLNGGMPSEPVPLSECLRVLNEEHGLTGHSPEEIRVMRYLTQPALGYDDPRDLVRAFAKHNGDHAYQRVINKYEDMVRELFHSLTLAYHAKANFVDPEGKTAAHADANIAGMNAARSTMMGITENFLDYLDDAFVTGDALYRFDESLGEEGVDQDVKFGELDIEEELKDDPDLKRAIGAVTRYVEGFLFSHDAGENYTSTDYMSDDPDVIRREVETVSDINIRSLREIISTVRELESARKDFWRVQLIGQPEDKASGVPKRLGINSIKDEELRAFIEESIGAMYRGVYKAPAQIE